MKEDSWLNSESFLKRSLVIAGYNAFGILLVYGSIILIMFMVGVMIGLFI